MTAQPYAAETDAYTARHLLVLEGLEAVRKRPGMYIGSTDSRGLMHCVWELLDNAVDEALAGYGDAIDVIVYADGSVEVRDTGRGIPVDVEPKTGLTGVEVVFTKLHAGGKFGGGAYGTSGGLHGVGASVVNALAARLDVEVDRDGATWTMSFRRGRRGIFDGPGPKAPFRPGGGLAKARRLPRKVTGTRVRFWPDPQIFLRDARIDLDALIARARQTAFLVPGLAITIRDETTAYAETFRFSGGTKDFADYLAAEAGAQTSVSGTLQLRGTGQFTETVPVLDDRGHSVPQDVIREMVVDVALRWDSGYDTVIRSFVNVVATPKGGSHVTGFERAVVKVVSDAARSARLVKDEPIVKDDVLEGLTAVVSVRFPEPQFDGQTKEVLGTPAATRIVFDVVSRGLRAFFSSTRRVDRQASRAVLEKVVAAARTRRALRAHKEAQRRKNALESAALPAKLADCRSTDASRTELFIVEGDSALGTAKLARNSEFQALLPIRGKILNVQKADLSDMLNNAECAAIIQVIGAGSGRSFSLDAVRYGKVIIMTDADVDGAHIRCLLLTLFFRYMRPLLDAGRIFAAVPPLHRIEVSGRKDPVYTYSDAELHRLLADLDRQGIRYKTPQRYKGLGEMDAAQLAETTMDPAHRVLRRMTLTDAAAAEAAFELLMGGDVVPRKEFIAASAATLDRSRIDV
ncbi:MAG: type IIA DNA topoisomerase subunit B [Acidothermus cellulolyticus]|jgi:DNA gyrase subunit B|nr:DNA topoisomerase IV subunit B [Acidothermus cellulolyticus]MBX5446906.1 type IIA DNA topoisomerase subunit B [Acidothermus cellulolyticus]MCL6550474.1 type IIA DNA topoisomerase subunit B [Acidothermus cellulolyticus]